VASIPSGPQPEPPESTRTEIAHVLFTDIVGYSNVPMDQQRRLLQELQDIVRGTSEFQGATARDQLITLPTGDGMALVFFGSPEDAVQCALQIGRELRRRPSVQLRMGLHSGPVYRVADINASRNVAGGGINLAQRVMDCGDAGHILLSDTIAKTLEQLSTWGACLHDLGETHVKHGLKVHVYNLYSDEVGNAETPASFRRSSPRLNRLLHPSAPVDQPATLPAQPRPATRARWGWVGTSAVALGTLLFFVWKFSGSQPALSFAARDWILVTDCDNRTGKPLFDRSLDVAVTVGLEQSTHANVFPRSRVATSLQRMKKDPSSRVDEAIGRDICVRESLRALLSYSISAIDDRYLVAARLIDPQTGEAVRSYSEQAKENEVLGSLNKIMTAVRADLGESLSSIQRNGKPLPLVTTSSLEALKLYADGSQFWIKGKYNEAVHDYESAVALDPDFAMAHAALGQSYASHIFNDPKAAREHTEKALALSTRTTDRERMNIEVAEADVRGDTNEAITRYGAYLARFPDDLHMRYNLASLLMRNQRPADAVHEFQEVIRLDPNYAPAEINLATSYSLLGRYPDALAHYSRAFELEPTWLTSTNLNHEYGFTLLRAGDEDKARNVFAMAVDKPDMKARGLRSVGLMEMLQGRYAAAREHLDQAALDNTSGRRALNAARDQLLSAILFQSAGNARAALEHLDKSLALVSDSVGQMTILARLGVLYARGHAMPKAMAVLAKVQAQTDERNASERSQLHWLQGEIALARGDTAAATDTLALAATEEKGPLTAYSLARALVRGQLMDRAIAQYEAFLDNDLAFGWEPQQDWLTAHYELASIHAARGESAKAKTRLHRLLQLWKNADPGLPLLVSARALDARLGKP
jgi:tetratricopeptide (TPR) repeat protein